jgi:hypothetical protein
MTADRCRSLIHEGVSLREHSIGKATEIRDNEGIAGTYLSPASAPTALGSKLANINKVRPGLAFTVWNLR